MLRITNGKQTLVVTKGAFKELYSNSGWSPVENTPILTPLEPPVTPGDEDSINSTMGQENIEENSPNVQGESTNEEDTLKNMSEVELKQYASLLGIKTKNLKTREELMEAIKSHQE